MAKHDTDPVLAQLVRAVFVPVVVAVVLAFWIVSVFRADRHPASGPGKMRRRPVIGGVFRSSGGRQVSPRRDAPAAVGDEAGPGAAVGSEDQQPPFARRKRAVATPGEGRMLVELARGITVYSRRWTRTGWYAVWHGNGKRRQLPPQCLPKYTPATSRTRSRGGCPAVQVSGVRSAPGPGFARDVGSRDISGTTELRGAGR